MHFSCLITLIALTTTASAATTVTKTSTASQSSASSTINKGSIYGLIGAANNKYQTSGIHRLLASDKGYQPVIDILNNPGANTVFLPNDKAIQSYLDRNLPNLQKGKYPAANDKVNNVTMLNIVKQHITTGRYATTSFNHPAMIKQSILTDKAVDTLGYGSPVLIDTNNTYAKFNDKNWRTQNAKSIQWNVGNGWSSADIVQRDIPTTNGYLNVIDEVITPPSTLKDTISYNSEISQISNYIDSHEEISNYMNSLNNATIFLPNNEALNETNLNDLSDDEGKNILQNYVVPGVYYTSNLTEMAAKNKGVANLNTSGGEQLPVAYNNENYTVNNTGTITSSNIFYNGGVVHVIDHLLSPIQQPSADQNSTESAAIVEDANTVNNAST